MRSNARLKILRWDCKEGHGLLFPGLATGGTADPQDSHRPPGGGGVPAHRAVDRTAVTRTYSEKLEYPREATKMMKMRTYFFRIVFHFQGL